MRIGRHLEGAEFDEAKAPRGAIRRKHLVDADFGAMRIAGNVGEQIAEQPVDEPTAASSPHPAAALAPWRFRVRRAWASLRASSMRGAWLVGPTNRPEKR